MASRSPLSETLTLDYDDSWVAVNRLTREGQSWSGREANCAFLNDGQGAFVDVSYTIGLGHQDDGRNFVAMDWDGDGDLDLWVKNRTAPQLRFMRNDGARGGWLRLKLEQSGPNGDAIGARVEVHSGGRLIVREVRAGSGYLVQNSQWLHFGLGSAREIERLTVRWPSGEEESFQGAAPRGSYSVRRGAGRVEAAPTRAATPALVPSTPKAPRPRGNARIALTQHLLVPDFEVETFKGETRPLSRSGARAKPVLLSFWASWCPNCLKELRAWSEQAQTLEGAGVEVLALSVDEGPLDAKAMWQGLAPSFEAAMASNQIVAIFDLLQRVAVDRQREMVVPTSFLLDMEGRIAVIYRGPVDVETIARDARALSEEPAAFAGAPFPGRSFAKARGVRLFEIARRLLDRDAPGDALTYLDSALAELGSLGSKHRDAPSLADALMRTGIGFMNAGDHALATRTLERATNLAPDDAIIWFARAKLHAVQSDNARAIVAVERATTLDPNFANAWNMLGSLRFIEKDVEAAIEAYQQATEVDPAMPSAWSGLGMMYLTTGRPGEGLAAFQTLVRIDPRSVDGWTGLGVCLVQTGQAEAGVNALEHVLTIEPQNARVLGILKSLGRR